jgi:hypothetical protein
MRTYNNYLTNFIQHFQTTLFCILCSLLLVQVSCVSVNVGAGLSEKSADLKFTEPGEPFVKKNDSISDRLWTSSDSGNSISYLSECTLKTDPSLEFLQTDYISVLRNPVILQSQIIQYNQREGIRFRSKGALDGVPVQFESLIFKKNNCNYTLTYGGREKNFEKEKNYFENFLKDFVVP